MFLYSLHLKVMEKIDLPVFVIVGYERLIRRRL